jgi:hypothetical protein
VALSQCKDNIFLNGSVTACENRISSDFCSTYRRIDSLLLRGVTFFSASAKKVRRNNLSMRGVRGIGNYFLLRFSKRMTSS